MWEKNEEKLTYFCIVFKVVNPDELNHSIVNMTQLKYVLHGGEYFRVLPLYLYLYFRLLPLYLYLYFRLLPLYLYLYFWLLPLYLYLYFRLLPLYLYLSVLPVCWKHLETWPPQWPLSDPDWVSPLSPGHRRSLSPETWGQGQWLWGWQPSRQTLLHLAGGEGRYRTSFDQMTTYNFW